jgi:hypothetical protein
MMHVSTYLRGQISGIHVNFLASWSNPSAVLLDFDDLPSDVSSHILESLCCVVSHSALFIFLLPLQFLDNIVPWTLIAAEVESINEWKKKTQAVTQISHLMTVGIVQ